MFTNSKRLATRTGSLAAVLLAMLIPAAAQTPSQSPVSAIVPTAGATNEASPAAVPEAARTSPPSEASAEPASCFVPPAKLSEADVEAFLARPESLLETYSGDDLSLANRVRALAGSDGRTLPPLLLLSNAANAKQVIALGSGLGRAAVGCAGVDPNYAQKIQESVADHASAEFRTAFVTASNDVQVAAVQGAGSGRSTTAAGLAGGGVAGPGTAGLGGDDVVPTAVEDRAAFGRGAIVFDDGEDSDEGGDNGDVSPSEAM